VGHRAYLFGKAQLDAIVPVFDDFLSGPIAASQPRRIVLIGGAAHTCMIAIGLLQLLAAFLWLLVPPLVVPMPVVRIVTEPAQHAFFQRLAIVPTLVQVQRLGAASTPNNNIRRWTKPTIPMQQR
jgi:hypothetical protein